MIFAVAILLLVTTATGALIGSALVGLVVGVGVIALAVGLAALPEGPRRRRRSRR